MPTKILLSLCKEDSDKSLLEAAKTIANTSKSEVTLLYVSSEDITSADRDYFNKVNTVLQEEGINTAPPALLQGD